MTISRTELDQAFENEWYGVRYSGEIPEIVLCSALYYLSEDRNGPGMELSDDQLKKLVEAAALRYREIVLRDLDHANRTKNIYRGIKRSITNWHRFQAFCSRQNLDPTPLRHEVAAALLLFLAEEVAEVEGGNRAPSINCSFWDVRGFAVSLGLDETRLPVGLSRFCPDR